MRRPSVFLYMQPGPDGKHDLGAARPQRCAGDTRGACRNAHPGEGRRGCRRGDRRQPLVDHRRPGYRRHPTRPAPAQGRDLLPVRHLHAAAAPDLAATAAMGVDVEHHRFQRPAVRHRARGFCARSRCAACSGWPLRDRRFGLASLQGPIATRSERSTVSICKPAPRRGNRCPSAISQARWRPLLGHCGC